MEILLIVHAYDYVNQTNEVEMVSVGVGGGVINQCLFIIMLTYLDIHENTCSHTSVSTYNEVFTLI